MSKALVQAFQDALEALTRGEPLEEVLASFPEYDEELRPLLNIALSSSYKVEDLHSRTSAQGRSRTRMLQHAATHRGAQERTMPFWTRLRFSSVALIIALAILLSSTGIWVASAQSLPGDPFYGIKRRAEELNLSLTPSKDSRYALDIQYRQRRVDEVLRLLVIDRIEAVNFEATLREQKDGLWDVGRVLVIVTADTQLNGPFTLGDEVEVHGMTTTSDAVLATSIDLKRYDLIGIVQTQESINWVIDSRKIDVSNALIDPDINVGDLVEVEVEVTHDGLHQALLLRRFLTTSTLQTTTEPTQPTIQPREFDNESRFEGHIDSLNRSVVIVDSQVFYLLEETEIEGVLSPGTFVRVDAAQDDSGTWFALEIRVEDLGADHGDEMDTSNEGNDEEDSNQVLEDDKNNDEEDEEEDIVKDESDDDEPDEEEDDKD